MEDDFLTTTNTPRIRLTSVQVSVGTSRFDEEAGDLIKLPPVPEIWSTFSRGSVLLRRVSKSVKEGSQDEDS